MKKARPPDVSGLCATCRYIEAHLQRYTSEPWGVAFSCAKEHVNQVPHVTYCHDYEREPGAD